MDGNRAGDEEPVCVIVHCVSHPFSIFIFKSTHRLLHPPTIRSRMHTSMSQAAIYLFCIYISFT
jgi:hypothetical protein